MDTLTPIICLFELNEKERNDEVRKLMIISSQHITKTHCRRIARWKNITINNSSDRLCFIHQTWNEMRHSHQQFTYLLSRSIQQGLNQVVKYSTYNSVGVGCRQVSKIGSFRGNGLYQDERKDFYRQIPTSTNYPHQPRFNGLTNQLG